MPACTPHARTACTGAYGGGVPHSQFLLPTSAWFGPSGCPTGQCVGASSSQPRRVWRRRYIPDSIIEHPCEIPPGTVERADGRPSTTRSRHDGPDSHHPGGLNHATFLDSCRARPRPRRDDQRPLDITDQRRYLSAAAITSLARSSIEANGPTAKLSLADSTPGCGRVGAIAWAARTANTMRLRSSASNSRCSLLNSSFSSRSAWSTTASRNARSSSKTLGRRCPCPQASTAVPWRSAPLGVGRRPPRRRRRSRPGREGEPPFPRRSRAPRAIDVGR